MLKLVFAIKQCDLEIAVNSSMKKPAQWLVMVKE